MNQDWFNATLAGYGAQMPGLTTSTVQPTLSGSHSNDSSPSEVSPSAGDGGQTQEQGSQPAVKPATKNKRRSCDPCRLRRTRCVRDPGRDECQKCIALSIKCMESAPRARTSQKGARIAQAKLLYGDTSESGQVALYPASSQLDTSRNLSSLAPPAERLMISSAQLSVLLDALIPGLTPLKVARLPLLRWIDIDAEWKEAGGRLTNMDQESQALFLSLAALAARTSHSPLVVGDDAPSLVQISNDPRWRSSLNLCQYGRKREVVASELLKVACQKINEAGVFTAPSLRSAATLAIAEILILVYQDSIAFGRGSARSARPFSAAVASHLRIYAEECDGQPATPFGFYSSAWTAIIRDCLVSSVTGRALDFSTHDIYLMLKFNEGEEIPVPNASALVESWINSALEGPLLMQLWGCVVKEVRNFVNEVTQPLAVAKTRLNIGFFDGFYAKIAECRTTLQEAMNILRTTNQARPDQERVLACSMEFMLAQAHRIILWRCTDEQFQRAQASRTSFGVQGDSFDMYKDRLQALRIRSSEEAFQGACRVMEKLLDALTPNEDGSAEFFIPGYFVYEGLLVWASLIIDTATLEEGGRADYTLAEKLAYLRVIRDGVAITGWSSSTVQPHLEHLEKVINGLDRTQSALSMSSSMSSAGGWNPYLANHGPTAPLRHWTDVTQDFTPTTSPQEDRSHRKRVVLENHAVGDPCWTPDEMRRIEALSSGTRAPSQLNKPTANPGQSTSLPEENGLLANASNLPDPVPDLSGDAAFADFISNTFKLDPDVSLPTAAWIDEFLSTNGFETSPPS